MPSMKMGMQTGNSCAAHCTVVAIAELFDTRHRMTPQYAENTVWPAIKFVPGESPLTDALSTLNNSDPRRLVAFANATGGGEAVKAELLCDEVLKAVALTYVDGATGTGLSALFNMMKGAGSTVTTAIDPGMYYNCSFLMFSKSTPSANSYVGMHNILLTRLGNIIWYYNSNETIPDWKSVRPGVDWKVLTGQNNNSHSYVYTGVTVSMVAMV